MLLEALLILANFVRPCNPETWHIDRSGIVTGISWSSGVAKADHLPERLWTPAIHAAVAQCWHEAREHCIAECGGSLYHATICQVGPCGQVNGGGLGCTMPSDYDACVQTYKLRQEVERLRKLLESRDDD